MKRNPSLFTLVLLSAVLTTIAISPTDTLASSASRPPLTSPSEMIATRPMPGDVFVTANGIALQAGAMLPIFSYLKPQVNLDTVNILARGFSSVSLQPIFTDTYGGSLRFTVPNTTTNTILQQFGATAGFYLFNAHEAFSETVRPGSVFDTTAAQKLACMFLLNKGLVPSNVIVPGAPQQCDINFSANPYKTTAAMAASLNLQNNAFGQQQIGLIVQVPMSIDTSRYSQIPSVPLGGAGGHISLYFRTTMAGDTGFSLDSSVPGLAALAMPFYGRQFNFFHSFPSLDAALVTQQVGDQVRAAYPGATVNVPPPSLMYMVSDAGRSQMALEPDYVFQGIQVTLPSKAQAAGETFVLNDIVMPAVQSGSSGFGPTLTITSPTNGSTFTPGANVSFSGTLSGGTAPYTYTWSLADGTTVLGSGTLANSSQTMTLTTNQLPAVSHGGSPASVQVVLSVTDTDGAERTIDVNLTPTIAPELFFPFVFNGFPGTTAPGQSPRSPTSPRAVAYSNYSFGVEQASDYPPYGPGGPDLPGVVPDIGGFRSGLLSYGWNSTFYWANASAWEKDWRDCTLGGGDCTYGVDRADFAYYSGHGNDGGIAMPSNVTSTWFDASNARFQNLRWVGFSSCRTLRVQGFAPPTEPIRRWFNAFQGAHMLLGFNSNMGDIAFGGPLIDNMRMPTFLGIPMPWAQRTIREAWVLTAFNMNAGKPAYIYALGANGYNAQNDKLPLPTDPLLPRPYPVAWYYWVWWNE